MTALFNLKTATEAEIAMFGRYARVVTSPEAFLGDAAKGKLTPEAVEAARATMPQMTNALMNGIYLQMQRSTEPLTASSQRTISMLLGLPTGLHNPMTVARLQLNYAPAPQPSQQAASPVPPNGGPDVNVAQNTASAADMNQARSTLQGPGYGQ